METYNESATWEWRFGETPDFTNSIENLEGLFKVQLGAFVTKKGEQTFESKTYESIESIVQTFLKECYGL